MCDNKREIGETFQANVFQFKVIDNAGALFF